LIPRIDRVLGAHVNRPHAADILEIADELERDLIVWGRTDGRG
jgi:hypothetical protein